MPLTPTWRFAPSVHAVIDSGALVMLDIRADAYYCLPAAGEGLPPGPIDADVKRLPRDLLAELAAAGLIVEAVSASPRGLAVTPVTSDLSRDVLPRPRLADGARLSQAMARLAPSFWRKPFAEVLDHGRRRRQLLAGDRGELAETLLAQARLFNAVLPWSPVQGACLFQATLLLEFLAARGLAADWVFGVRTWPFSAHCWVQAGGAVLNDTVERVAPYRQILRV